VKSTVTKKKARARSAAQTHRAKTASNWRVRCANDLQIVEAPRLARFDWLAHGFSTRVGGTSAFSSTNGAGNGHSLLNLGFTDWDSRESVTENRKRFFRAIGADGMPVVTLRQIHSDIVHRVSGASADAHGNLPKGDALFAAEEGVVLAVQTADCIPILLVDTKKKAVAAIHAGWRGTLRRIAEKTIGRMQMELGTDPNDVIAALGPGIRRCCYEVGHEVAREFAAQFPNARAWFEGPFDAVSAGNNDPNWLPWLTMKPPGHAPPSARVHLDLIAANRAILVNAGVPGEHISDSGFCTSCRTDLFFSYRRDRTTGRMMAAVGITRA